MPLSVPIANHHRKAGNREKNCTGQSCSIRPVVRAKRCNQRFTATRPPSGSALILRVCLGCCSGSCSQHPPSVPSAHPSPQKKKSESSYVCHFSRPEEGPGQTGFANIHLRISRHPPPGNRPVIQQGSVRGSRVCTCVCVSTPARVCVSTPAHVCDRACLGE